MTFIPDPVGPGWLVAESDRLSRVSRAGTATDASKGSIAFDLDDVVRHEWPELSSTDGWRFFPERRCFARLVPEAGVEERAFPAG